MELEEAKKLLKKTVEENNAVVQEAREDEDMNLIELTNGLVTQSTAIETVLKELERLTYARNWYFEHTTAQIATPEQLHKILSFDYVSKDKIREKIEELKEEKYILSSRDAEIKLLQELLESEG